MSHGRDDEYDFTNEREMLTPFERQIWAAAYGAACVVPLGNCKRQADRAVREYRKEGLPRSGELRVREKE